MGRRELTKTLGFCRTLTPTFVAVGLCCAASTRLPIVKPGVGTDNVPTMPLSLLKTLPLVVPFSVGRCRSPAGLSFSAARIGNGGKRAPEFQLARWTKSEELLTTLQTVTE